MRTRTINVGDILAVPISTELAAGFPVGKAVDVSLDHDALVVRPVGSKARAGWDEAFRQVEAAEVDRDAQELQAFRETPGTWDAKEWQW